MRRRLDSGHRPAHEDTQAIEVDRLGDNTDRFQPARLCAGEPITGRRQKHEWRRSIATAQLGAHLEPRLSREARIADHEIEGIARVSAGQGLLDFKLQIVAVANLDHEEPMGAQKAREIRGEAGVTIGNQHTVCEDAHPFRDQSWLHGPPPCCTRSAKRLGRRLLTQVA